MGEICMMLKIHAKARIRNYKRLLAELLFPSALFVLMFLIKLVFKYRFMEMAHYSEAVNRNFLLERSNVRNIYYSSNNSDFTNALMKEVAEKLNVDSVTGYHNKNDLMAVNEQNLKKHKFNLAVIFKVLAILLYSIFNYIKFI